jgi:transcriptional regulator with XRE-family HTH domain
VTRLRYERIRRQLSQVTVAHATKIPRSFLSYAENGRFNLTDEQLARLAKLFDVENPDDLLKQVALLPVPEPPQGVTQ